jgi:hypothetical protein
MAAPYNPPVKNEDFRTYIELKDIYGNPVANPTLIAGDVQVKIDTGAYINIDTLPSVDTAGEDVVNTYLIASEMNGDNIIIRFKDLTDPPEWMPFKLVLVTSA